MYSAREAAAALASAFSPSMSSSSKRSSRSEAVEQLSSESESEQIVSESLPVSDSAPSPCCSWACRSGFNQA